MSQATTVRRYVKVDAARASVFEWRIGFLLGLPIAIPSPPYYWFAFLCFFAVVLRDRHRPVHGSAARELAIAAIVVVALLSNIVGLVRNNLDTGRIVTTSFFFLFFLFAGFIHDKRALLDGLCRAMLIWAILIVCMGTYLRIYENGLLLFSVPEFRLWGSEFFPDWPNYIAFLLSLAFLLNVLAFKRPFAATVQFAAALLTTSRTPFIALGFVIVATVLLRLRARRGKWILASIGALALVVLAMQAVELMDVDADLADRLLVFEDREDIYTFGFDLFMQSPFVGHGAILLDESIGFTGQPSFHNSYLDIAVRHGFFGLVLFLALLIPTRTNLRRGGVPFASVIMFFLVGSLFQNFLKHPHIILLYVVFIEAGSLFDRTTQLE